jgi:hypothetical protein
METINALNQTSKAYLTLLLLPLTTPRELICGRKAVKLLPNKMIARETKRTSARMFLRVLERGLQSQYCFSLAKTN